MANIPDTLGLQTVTPTEAPPDAGQRINATPEAFGAAAARGQEKLGEGEAQGAQGAFSALRFYNEAAADHATNNYQDSLNKILHGDPNKMVTGPDGQQTPDVGYLGLKGRAAMDARAGVEKQITELQQKTKGTLLAPASQFDFDRYSSRLRAVTSSQIGTHADTQANNWYKETAAGEVKVNTASLVANVDDPALVQQFAGGIVNGYVKIAMLDGAKPGDAAYEAAVQKGKAAAARSQILAVGAKPDGAPAADRMTENYKAILGDDYHVLKDHFRARTEEEGATSAGVNVFNEVTGRSAPSGTTTPKLNETKAQIQDKLKPLGIALNITSEARDAAHNHAVGGAKDSEHLRGNATDVSLAGKTDDQKQKIVDAVLSTPGVTGFGYYPNSDSIHFDVGHPGKTAWGQDQQPGSVGANWPAWMTQKVNGWKSGAQTADVGGERPALNAPPDLKEPEGQQAKFARQMQEGVDKIDAMGLPPKQYERTMRAFRESMSTHEIASNLQEKAKTETYHKALGDYVDDMVAGNFAGMVQKIQQDTRIPNEHKMALIDMARHQSGNPIDPKSYGTGWLKATQGVLKNPGEEGYIGDASSIVKMGPAGTGELTAAGVQDVLKTRGDARKDIDQHGIQQSRASVMKWAESQIVVDHEMLYPGMPVRKDKKGEDAYNGSFVPKVNAAYSEFLKKPNANPVEFWTQENMQKLMEGVRSQKDIQEEKLRGALQNAPPEDTAKVAIPPAPGGVRADAWENIVRQPPATETGKAWPVKAWGDYLKALVASPTPAHIKEFNDTFGASGYTFEDIDKRLHKPPAAAPGGWSDFTKGQSVPGLYEQPR